MSLLAQRIVHRFVHAWGKHYDLKPGTTIEAIIKGWVENDDKATDSSMPGWYSPDDVWPYREYTWTRENSRSGFARVEGKLVDLPGPLKWDALAIDLKKQGWDPKEPLHLAVGKNGQAKVGEGNHRLALAREIKLARVPVFFHFNVKVELMEGQGSMYRRQAPPSPAAVKKVVEEEVHRPSRDLTPEEQKQMDEIAKLLGI